ncbi:hypothetical protein Vretimale_10199 [Volvox reticuliferus]|uniref:Small ribosomal subunit protein uS10 domain-containing protein n=1 Tax=Volvox reticuliferus TaxID=1737510 RepID=A0A8J4LQ84_9CHLO|nr:hypothetical protein Vretifemale_519 [Volvox reticuliferus]GIM05807.1 hypothetical protein Vretimale_10199 [Volvox reticuliferus]
MQSSALRAAWALQNARGLLPATLQHVLTLLVNAPLPADATLSSNSCLKQALHSTRNAILHLGSDPASIHAQNDIAWVRRHASTMPAASAASASGAYAIEIAVQGFEKRYVDMACNTIDDLLMLAFAPKSFSALPVGSPSDADAPVNLAFGAIRRRDVHLPWRRTRFTLLRSPHIDKQGMEQFERREYKTVLTAATNSDEELRRLLEALKIYQFTGVRIRVDVTSAQRVELPQDVQRLLAGAAAPPVQQAPSPAAGGSGGQTIIGSPMVTLPAPRSPAAMFQEELAAVLRVLRPLIWTGLQGRRRALDAVPEFASWRQQQPKQQRAELPPTPVASAVLADEDAVDVDMDVDAAGGEDAYGRLMRQRMRQQMELLKVNSAGAERPAAAASYGLEPAVAAELLARIDAELLNTHEAALQGALPPLPPGEGATNTDVAGGPEMAASVTTPALDDSNMSPADYAYAVLKYVQYVDALCEAARAAEGQRRMDAALQLAAPGLALRLLQLWSAATSAEFKQHLGLPPADVEKRILEEQLRREEMARAAAALMKPGGSGSGSGSGAPSDAAPGSPAAGWKKAVAAATVTEEPGKVQGQPQGQGRGQRPSGREGQRIREGQDGRDRVDGSRRGGQQQPQPQPRRGPGQSLR